jgi:DNA repair exonuclease SbcCD nuclease subunit
MVADMVIKNKEVDAIFAADIHLRDTQPIARTDDYWKAQGLKFSFILGLAAEFKVPLYVAGDFFDQPKVSQYLEAWVIRTIRECGKPEIIVIPGQHDLPNHNLDLIDKSSLMVLESALSLKIRKTPWDIGFAVEKIKERTVMLMHTMVYKETPIHEKVGGSKAAALLKRNPKADIMITGDNHETFIVEKEGRLLVNPGSMMRMDADQAKHRPVVFLYSAKNNKVKPVYLSIEKEVLSREHLDRKEIKNKKILSFVRRIKDDYEVGISFRKNMKAFLTANEKKIRPPVKDLVWELIDQDE